MKLKQLVENINIGFFIAVREKETFVYRYANQVLQNDYFYRKDMIGNTVEGVFGKAKGKKLIRHYQDVSENRRTYGYETQIKAKSGNMVVRVDIFPYYENNVCIGVYGLVRDITEFFKIKEDVFNIIKNANIYIWEFDCENQKLSVKYNFTDLANFDYVNPAQRFDQVITEFVHPDDYETAKDILGKYIKGEIEEYNFECRVSDLSGGYFWAQSFGIKQKIKGKKDPCIRGFCIDISNQKEISEKLKKNEERLRLVLKNTSDMLVQMNSQKNIVYVSPSFCRVTGKKEEEWLGNNIFSSIHPEDLSLLYNKKKNAYEFHKTDILRFLTMNGYKWIEWHTSKKFEIDKSITITLTGHDVDQRENARIGMEYTLSHDSLTGLLSRAKLEELLVWQFKDKKRCQKAAGIFFNIDNFKMINEMFGQQAGDECLRSVGRVISENVPEDCVVARMSDDKFFALISDYESKEAVIDLVCNLLEKIKDIPQQETFMIDDKINVNAGIAYYPEDALTGSDLIFFAEYAVSVAKKKGKRQYDVFKPEYFWESHRRYEILKQLCQGIENNEFVMHYQPIVNVRLNRIEKVEALVRWNHPQKGLVFPFQFIEIAEESKEIIPLGDYLFEKIISDFKKFRGTRYEGIPITFNISPVQMGREGFAEHIINIARENRVACGSFYLEITEETILGQTGESEFNFEKLREAGFHIAIDDFGIKYSSLSYLESLNYDALKVDRSFVRNLDKGKTSMMIFKFIKGLADEFGKECIVEGVETKKQLEQIQKIGFEKIQGFYFAKPMSLQKLLEYHLPKEE